MTASRWRKGQLSLCSRGGGEVDPEHECHVWEIDEVAGVIREMLDIDSTPMNIYSLDLLWVSRSFGAALPLSVLTYTNQLFHVRYLQTLWTMRIIHFHTFYTNKHFSQNNKSQGKTKCAEYYNEWLCVWGYTHHSHWEYICFLQN